MRPYRADDLEAVRRICADTGFLGQPVDRLFEDRELFVDYLTRYYTHFEPEACYLMGCRRPLLKQSYQLFANLVVATKALYRCWRRPYNRASRDFGTARCSTDAVAL